MLPSKHMLIELLCADLVHAAEAWWDEKDSNGCHCVDFEEELTEAERTLALAIWRLQEADLLVAKVPNEK